jgi:O-antigen ligase
MNESVPHQAAKRTHFTMLVLFCLLLPNIHITALASQVVLPREFFLFLYSPFFILFLSQQKKPTYNTFFIVALGFLAWQACALVWSSDLSTGIEDVLNAYVFLLVAFAFYQIRDGRLRSAILNTLILAISLALLIGILQNFGWNPFDLHQAATPSSTFNNKNLAASASLLFLPIILIRLLISPARSHKILFSLAAIASLSFILISHTKGVWLAGLCLLIVAVVTYLSRQAEDRQSIKREIAQNRLYLIGIILISLTIFVAPGTRNKGEMNLETYSLSSLLRLGFYRDALPLIVEHPLTGVGSGALRREFRAQPGGDYILQHAEGNKYLNRLHNDHLQFLVEQGIVGLTLWLALLLILYKTTISYMKSSSNSLNDRLIVYALLLGASGMLLHAMVSFPIRSVSTGSLFWATLGLTLSHLHDQDKSDSPAIPAKSRLPLVAALLMISVFAIYNVTHRTIGSYYTKQTVDTLSSGHCFAAKFYLKNLIETTSLGLGSAQLLATTYDYCGGESPEQTTDLMDRILAYEPNHSLALLVKANAAYQLGQSDEAYNLYSHAQQVNPQEPRTYLGMANIAAANGQTDDAIEMVKKALVIDGDNEVAKSMLLEFEGLQQKPDR